MAERALITGATGFAGGRLARRLSADGWEVHAVVRRPADDPVVRSLSSFARVHHHDGSTDGMIAVVRASAPSVVFHLSSKFVAEHRPGDVESLVRDNILFGLQLLEAMQIAGAARLLNTGSAWQHFHNRDYSPVCLYAATKQAFADILAYYVEVHHFRAVTLELTDTYGAGDGRRKLIPIMRDAERGGDELAMVPADVPMDFVHVDDAVEAFVVAARRLLASDVAGHEIFAVRSGAPVTALELFATWERARGVRIAARWGERPLRAREVLQPWTQGTPLPDWQPKISLEEGLRTL